MRENEKRSDEDGGAAVEAAKKIDLIGSGGFYQTVNYSEGGQERTTG